MAKTEYTRESIENDIKLLNEGKFNKTKITIDFMDSYVAWFKPETIDKWVEDCLKIPMITRKIGKTEKTIRDVSAIRNLFINTYFYKLTDEAKEIEKENAKKKREAEKKIKEDEKNMTPEDKLRNKLNRLKAN